MTRKLVDELRKACKGLGELEAEDVVNSLLPQLAEMVASGREFGSLKISTRKKTGSFVRDALRRFRERAKLEQAEVAAMMECSEATLHRIEWNRGGLSLPQLNELIKIYKIPLDWAIRLRKHRKG